MKKLMAYLFKIFIGPSIDLICAILKIVTTWEWIVIGLVLGAYWFSASHP